MHRPETAEPNPPPERSAYDGGLGGGAWEDSSPSDRRGEVDQRGGLDGRRRGGPSRGWLWAGVRSGWLWTGVWSGVRGGLRRGGGALALSVCGLALASPLYAQTSPNVPPPLPPGPVCATCPPELAADPLVAFAQQFQDALGLWAQAPATAVLCVLGDVTSYQISIQPSTVAAPVGADCITKDGTDIGSAPLPNPTATALPPTELTPVPAGPVQPAPAQDTVIEQQPRSSAPTPTPTPRQSNSAPSSVSRSTPTPTPQPSSSSSRPRKPVPTPVLEDDSTTSARRPVTAPASGGVSAPPSASGAAGSSGAGAGSGASQNSTSGGQASARGQSGSDGAPAAADGAPAGPDQAAVGATPTGARTLPGVSLGSAAADAIDGSVLDPSLVQPGSVLLGRGLIQLRDSNGLPLSLADGPFTFTLSPDDAALLAGGGSEGPFRIFTFNPATGTVDEVPSILVLADDGSVTITVSQVPPAAAAVAPQPTTDVAAEDAGQVTEDGAQVAEDAIPTEGDGAVVEPVQAEGDGLAADAVQPDGGSPEVDAS